MKLVVGLGNPENKYNWTRHNTGFLVLDYYFKLHKYEWGAKPRLGAIYGKSDSTIFIKPQEYYNESGRAVVNYLNYYKISIDNLLVICDDFNLDFGKMRVRNAGSAGGNNGLKSIISQIGSQDFARLRIGTGNDELRKQIGDIDFVLSKFTLEEKEKLPEILQEASSRIDFFTKM